MTRGGLHNLRSKTLLRHDKRCFKQALAHDLYRALDSLRNRAHVRTIQTRLQCAVSNVAPTTAISYTTGMAPVILEVAEFVTHEVAPSLSTTPSLDLSLT